MINGGSSNLVVFPPDSNPYGVNYAEWTTKWWQWVPSIPKEFNPVLDENGKNCAQGQSGPVWFLAGTAGGSAKRTCRREAEYYDDFYFFRKGELVYGNIVY